MALASFGFADADSDRDFGGKLQGQDAAGIGGLFGHLFVIDFDFVGLMRLESDDEDSFALFGGELELVGIGRGDDGGFRHTNRLESQLRIQDGGFAILEELELAVEIAEPFGVLLPGGADKEAAEEIVMKDKGSEVIAE